MESLGPADRFGKAMRMSSLHEEAVASEPVAIRLDDLSWCASLSRRMERTRAIDQAERVTRNLGRVRYRGEWLCREGPRYSGQQIYQRVTHLAIRRRFVTASANVGTGVSAITVGSRTTASTSYASSRAANLRLGTPTRNRMSSFTSSRVNSSSSPMWDARRSGQAPASHSRQALAMVITS